MKKINGLLILVPLFLTIIGLTFSCKSKPPEEKSTSAMQKFKMTTKIPEGIAIPDKIESRIGTLNFFDGFPDNESVEKLYDNLDFQRAVQAYLLGLAPVSQYANRKGILENGPVNLTVPIFEDIMNARSIFLTPNNSTPYTWFWLDLKEGPLVLEIPPRVLGLIDDMWYKFVTDLGFMGPDKGEGGKFLLLPPNYKGEIPKGYFVVHNPTFSIWIAWRTFLVNGDTKPEVDNVKKLTRIYPLSQKNNPPSLKFVNVSDKDFNTVAPADYTFWEYLNKVVQEEPTETVDPITLGLWASIGIRKGESFNPDERMKKILTEAALVGDATARAVSYRSREKDAYFYPNSAWCNPMNASGYTFEKDGVKLLDMNTFFYFYATGVTPAMDSKVVGQGSQYMAAFVDSKGNVLDGGKNYTLHLPPNIPVANFWSVILYDNQTRSMLQNDQKWPAITSQAKATLVNPDGSVDIYFGPKAPQGKQNNWIQTIPGKGWNTLLRIYGPLQPWFDKTWRPGEIVEVK